MKPEDQWTYEEPRNKPPWSVIALVLVVVLAAAMVVVVTGRSGGMGPAFIVIAVGVTIYGFRARARNTAVIDRRNGMVRTETVGAVRSRQNIRSLGEFDRVAVWERRTPIDAEHYVSQYSIVLLGSKGPLPLLTTGDEREASAVRDEVAVFLRFP